MTARFHIHLKDHCKVYIVEEPQYRLPFLADTASTLEEAQAKAQVLIEAEKKLIRARVEKSEAFSALWSRIHDKFEVIHKKDLIREALKIF